MESKPIIVIGGGGHARVVIDALVACGADVRGFVDLDPLKEEVDGLSRLGGDDSIYELFEPGSVYLVNGIGSLGPPGIRRSIYNRFRQKGYIFKTCIHPRAVVSPQAHLAQGVQIMAGAVVQPGATLRENTIVNTGATVDHDCRVGSHVHIAPGVTLSGDVSIGDCSHIGAGATVIQGIQIGSHSIVGAGSVVIRDVEEGDTVMGVPATRRIRKV